MLWTYAEPPTPTGPTSASAAAPTTRRPTPGARAPSTPTTSAAPPSSTCGTGSRPARPPAGDAAYEMLRGLTYLQTASGPNAGNVVLWMQPDGTLNPQRRARWSCPTRPTATRPTGWPAPSGRSARATPPSSDERPGVRALPAQRLDLAVAAVDRQVLDQYGDYLADRRPAHARPGSSPTAPTPPRRRSSGSRPTSRAGGSAAARTALSPAQRGHRRAARRRRPRTGPSARPALGAVPLGLARLGLA